MDSDILSLCAQRLMELRGLRDGLDTLLKQHGEDMPPAMAEAWTGVWGALHDAVNETECYHCPDGVAVTFPLEGPTCEACGWTHIAGPDVDHDYAEAVGK